MYLSITLTVWGTALMAELSKVLPLTDSCLPPLSRFKSRPGMWDSCHWHGIRRWLWPATPVFPQQLQMASNYIKGKWRNSKFLTPWCTLWTTIAQLLLTALRQKALWDFSDRSRDKKNQLLIGQPFDSNTNLQCCLFDGRHFCRVKLVCDFIK